MYPRVMLHTILHDSPGESPPLLIAHGLYGSARNWGVIAKRLSDRGQVIAVDMRNHGQSPWSDAHGYHDLAADLAEVIRAHGGRADVLGHSMGGKAAMALALAYPELVGRLVVADIAPVQYGHSQLQFIEAMQSVDLSKVTRRSDAEAQLGDLGVDASLQSFLTQSLDIQARKWRLNLQVLAAEMPSIMGFPDFETSWGGPVLFLSGAASDYVQSAHRETIRSYFPAAKFAKIPDAGHWLHAEKPREFEAAIRAWYSA